MEVKSEGSPHEETLADEDDELGDYYSCKCTRKSLLACGIHWQTLSLLAIIIVYLFVGGAIFTAIEGPNEERGIEEALAANESYFELLQYVVGNLTEHSNFTEEEAIAAVQLVANLAINASLLNTQRDWEFGPSVFFATVAITTIGYGNLAPQTEGGRIFFFFYAIFGIPLTLIFLGYLGIILTRIINTMLRLLLVRCKFRGKLLMRVMTFLIVAIAGITLFMLIPSIIFTAIEDWSYGESLYYTFVTLTTVGFGDFVPSVGISTSRTLNSLYRICVATWIWIGLVFVALILNQSKDLMENRYHKSKEHLTMAAQCIHKKTLALHEDVELQVVEKEPKKEKENPGEEAVKVCTNKEVTDASDSVSSQHDSPEDSATLLAHAMTPGGQGEPETTSNTDGN